MTNFNKPFVLISSDRPDCTERELTVRREQLRWILERNGYFVTECMGVWQGETETSYLVHGRPNKSGWPLAELTGMLARAYNQEAYIVYDGQLGRLYNGQNDELLSVLGEAYPAEGGEDRTVLPNGEAFKFKN
jgi:hypothetical protein